MNVIWGVGFRYVYTYIHVYMCMCVFINCHRLVGMRFIHGFLMCITRHYKSDLYVLPLNKHSASVNM